MKKTRHKDHPFLPAAFEVTKWEDIQPFYAQLLARELTSLAALQQWFLDRSELEGIIEEDAGWRYINMTRDTTNATYKQRYEAYVRDILPHLAPLTHQLNEKALQCPDATTLRQEAGFAVLFQCMENSIRIYRAENIPIFTQIKLQAQQYGHIVGAMTIELEGKELTLQQATVHLESTYRALRREVYEKISHRRLQDQDTLNDLYTALIKHRHQVAVNADFDNFRDYAFVERNRFDYTPQDCFAFHQAVKEEIVPLLNALAEERKDQLGVHVLKPWDHAVALTGSPPLRPFKQAEELLQKTITVFDGLDPFLGNCLRTMQTMGHLDVASRKGKAPGGYNYPLDKTGVPFIFMNATATVDDMITMLHEGGHAVHSFLTKDLSMNDFKHCPAEIAELASMSMELLTMEQWGVFFAHDKAQLKRAKKKHLMHIIQRLAWMATIDQFQHWVYENPAHTVTQRKTAWNAIFDSFSDSVTSWSGQETYKDVLWQKQLHLFEVPFYYIEYAIAQLGALGVWKNYQENPTQSLQKYLNALKLGYTRSVPQVYAAAGVPFDFSSQHLRKLVRFVKEAWKTL